jgi:hypothetical protein
MTCPHCCSWTPGKNFYCPRCGLAAETDESGVSLLLVWSAGLALFAVVASLFLYVEWRQ